MYEVHKHFHSGDTGSKVDFYGETFRTIVRNVRTF